MANTAEHPALPQAQLHQTVHRKNKTKTGPRKISRSKAAARRRKLANRRRNAILAKRRTKAAAAARKTKLRAGTRRTRPTRIRTASSRAGTPNRRGTENRRTNAVSMRKQRLQEAYDQGYSLGFEAGLAQGLQDGRTGTDD